MSGVGWKWPQSVGARLAILCQDVDTPRLLAVIDSERTHPTGRRRLGACRSDVDQIAVNQGRHADEKAFLRIGDLLGPKRMPVLCVERQQKAIISTANDLSLAERRAAMRVHPLLLPLRRRVRPAQP